MVIWVMRACATDAAASAPVARRLAPQSRNSLRLVRFEARTSGVPRAISITIQFLPQSLSVTRRLPPLRCRQRRDRLIQRFFQIGPRTIAKLNRQVGPREAQTP